MIKMKNKLMDDFFILPTLNGVYFVTGTDTEIGKTTITAQLVRQCVTAGQRVYAIKPVTAGLEDGVSRDAQRINRFANVTPPLAAIAPVRLATPCSPHIAAARDGVQLTTDALIDAVQTTVANYLLMSCWLKGQVAGLRRLMPPQRLPMLQQAWVILWCWWSG